MSAFFIATVSVKNSEKFQKYAIKAKETFDKYGGEVIARGKYDGNFVGNSSHQAIGVVRFPSSELMERWFSSQEYQAIVALREEAADMTITKYNEPTSS